MGKRLILFSTLVILLLSLLFIGCPQSAAPEDKKDDSISVGDSTNFADAILISTDGKKYNANLTVDDQDYYKFNGVSGTTYIIELFSDIDDVDTYMYLYNNAQSLLDENDDGGQGFQSKIIFECTSTETYYVMVEGYDGSETGNYSISASIYNKEQTPYLKSVSITPASLTAPNSISIAVDINKPAGVTINWADATLSSPAEYQDSDGQYEFIYLSYNGTSGYWEGQFEFNIYHESGTWIIENIFYSANESIYEYDYDDYESTDYYFDDQMDKLTDVPIAEVSVTTTNPDSERPVLNSITATPTSIDSTGTVNFSVSAADSLSGVSTVSIMLYNYEEEYPVMIDLNYNSISGNWEGSMNFSLLETGNWIVCNIEIKDNASNNNYYNYFPSLSETYYVYFDESHVVSTIPVVIITKTGSVSSVIKKSLTEKRSKYLQDRKIQIKGKEQQKIKKSRKK